MIDVQLRTVDGMLLGARFCPSPRPRSPRRVAVLHGGAGIPAFAYRHFARFLAEWGLPILTYDCRGVGRSRPRSLRGFRATTADWVEYDAAAAIAWVRERFGDDVLIGISHSIGALSLLGAPNAAQQNRLALIAPHTAYWGDYRAAYRLPMFLLWHGVMPLLARTLGYFPASALGLGEDLPAGIALEWASRRSPELRPRGDGPDARRSRELFKKAAGLERDVLAITFADDAFATAAGARRLFQYFPRLRTRCVTIEPAEAHLPRLGHFGFFRPAAAASLWPRFLSLLGSTAA